MSKAIFTVALSALWILHGANSAVIPVGDLPGRRVEVQAHRGGAGMRPEETLWAFSYAMEIGADVLEMDMVFTKDEIPVIWHDHWIQPEKCRDTTGKYVGEFIANLTLAELKTLDCGSRQLSSFPLQEVHPGATIATLEEVLDLVDCYNDKSIKINLETKLDPTHPDETLPINTYIYSPKVIPMLHKRGFLKRTTIQSFDWRTLIKMKEAWPDYHIPTVALLSDKTILPYNGTYPWLGGVDLAKFNSSWVAGAHSIGASIISPIFGTPGTINDPNHVHYVKQETVDEAHKLGMQIIPWTVDDEVSISYLLGLGVDAVISNYPERVMWVAKQRGMKVGKARNAHRSKCLKKASIPSSNSNTQQGVLSPA
ncbi:hypothetical protein FRB99_008302 [Tulasnella sp. 403]|nr:hypothetical protein FRB99_008302 [Tulasnella sp. 403]